MAFSREEELALRSLMQSDRFKASGTTPGVPSTGYNGLFNTPGLDPNIVTTYIPPDGLENFLERAGHVRTSVYDNPIFGIITGQTAYSGTQPTTGCDENVPTPGNLKLCQQTWGFGEMTLKSQPIEMDKLGKLINNGSPVDFNLLNNPFASDVASQLVPQNVNDFFRSTVAKATLELANDFKRVYAPLVWDGNPVNTAGSSGGYKEFNGLNRIVNTGYQDVISSQACAAADSLVMNFANGIVQNNASGIVRMFVETYRDRQYLAQQTQFGQVNYAWVMRKQLFLALTEVWPCAYFTFRCYTAAPSGSSATAFVESTAQAALRDSMRNGQYLLIDGVQVPVIIDNTLDEDNAGAGNFQSNAYLLPLSAPGKFGETGGQLLYMEYFDYRAQYGVQQGFQSMGPDNIYKVSGDGRFIAVLLSPTAFCRQVMMRTSKRVILRTPFLAGRIDNIRYNVYIHERNWQPGTSFFVDGGRSSFAGPSYASPI
jgi:hypothetical protein